MEVINFKRQEYPESDKTNIFCYQQTTALSICKSYRKFSNENQDILLFLNYILLITSLKNSIGMILVFPSKTKRKDLGLRILSCKADKKNKYTVYSKLKVNCRFQVVDS